jgi:ribosomal protein S18 acetylase RimI-like enzyme
MTVHISALAAADVNAVAALARIVWQRAYAGIITQAQIDTMREQRYNAPRLLGELETAGIWWDKATLAGQLVAFASTLLVAPAREMKVDKLYVDPQWQRRGVGGRLLALAGERALALGCDTLTLAVNKRNANAIAAYTKHGFRVRAAVCVDIGNDFVMDDFIMARSLR